MSQRYLVGKQAFMCLAIMSKHTMISQPDLLTELKLRGMTGEGTIHIENLLKSLIREKFVDREQQKKGIYTRAPGRKVYEYWVTAEGVRYLRAYRDLVNELCAHIPERKAAK